MKQKRFYSLLLLLFFCSSLTAIGQKAERKNVREGNKHYNKEEYEEAAKSYRRSLDVNPTSLEGVFNLANTLYKQAGEEKYQEAAELYQQIAEQGQRLLNDDPENAEKLSQVFHNLGNIGMKTRQYAQSVEAYKQALRLNPLDDETRYNLALAQKLLEDQEGDGGGDGENDNQEEDQQQDEQQEQNQDNQEEQQQPEDQSQNEQRDEPQDQSEQMSRDNAQQILDALLEDEKDTQEKVQKAQQQQMERRRTDKEW
ncbi:MAG: tetratricopeptide repeat protein [Tannerellaceae bacterium]|nr:tetratricopeptide repeat protein [Tannerellaceae bacterium]